VAEVEQIEAQLAAFGTRLGHLRSARGWTLDELAERTGLSKPFLSRLEAGRRQPSIAVVLTLAHTYGVSVGEMFQETGNSAANSGLNGDEAEPCVIVRGTKGRRVRGDGLSYLALSNKNRFANLQPMRLTVSANRSGDEMYQHEGEEWVYVLSGRLRLALAGRTHELSPGDAAHFDSRLPHRLTALDGCDAELILVACTIPEPATSPMPRPHRPRRAIR
jgi:transcriptional regulator with XRE-family HTH domain